jgi:simple sugar transport system substrate-binding protein/basic membrane protein A
MPAPTRGRRLALLACLAAAATISTAQAAPAEKAAILLPGSINDHSWNALGYQILQSLKADGFQTAYSENVADADEENALQDYAGRGDAIVIGHSGRFMSAMQDVGPNFPHTQFIVTSGNAGAPPNVMSIDWNNAQFGCELGLLAARMSHTHKVAGIYGLQGVPNITAQAGGFRLCAAKAGAVVTIVYVRDMEDAAAAKEAALALIASGNDVLTGKLNAAEAGLVEAAREKGVFVTGRSPDDTTNAPQAVLTNIIEDWPSMFRPVAEQVKAGKIAGTFTQYGYNTAPVTGASLQYKPGTEFNPVVPAAAQAELHALEQRFRTGAETITPTRQDARAGQ